MEPIAAYWSRQGLLAFNLRNGRKGDRVVYLGKKATSRGEDIVWIPIRLGHAREVATRVASVGFHAP